MQADNFFSMIFVETTMIVHVCFDITWDYYGKYKGNHMYMAS